MDQGLVTKAEELLASFQKTAYVFGSGVLDRVGPIAADLGENALVVGNTAHTRSVLQRVVQSLKTEGLLVNSTLGAQPNTPVEDVHRIAGEIRQTKSDVVVAVGGGSTIDAVKAAVAAASLGGGVERFFGTGLVSEALERERGSLVPTIAVQTAAGSGAHLTKYANVTDLAKGQKKLIVDEALMPARALFDYDVTISVDTDVTFDGIMDGMSHLVEVFFGIKAADAERYPVVEELIRTGLPLLLQGAEIVQANPGSREGRKAIGLATDLGALAIMIGSTNGPHLNSFSLVDIASHGRACGMLNPYYAVLFASAIEPQLEALGRIYADHGLIKQDPGHLSGRELALAVAKGMQQFLLKFGLPIALKDLPGFGEGHRVRILTATKEPQLRMKLENMPIPISPQLVDSAVGSVLDAAEAGDPSLVGSL